MKYKEDRKQTYHVLARGVIIKDDHLLIAHCIGMENTFLPGGHVEFREGMKQTLVREIEEEIGLSGQVIEYIGSVEAEFDDEDRYHQEINHVFTLDIEGVSVEENPVSQEKHLEFFWIHINNMEEHNLQPYPVRELIRNYKSGEKLGWGSTFES